MRSTDRDPLTPSPSPSDEPLDPGLVATVEVLDQRAEDLLVLDFRGRFAFTDHFVIGHGTSERQVKALAESVLAAVKDRTGRKPSVEGLVEAEWVLLDYGDFVVHLFQEGARAFYGLERLWGDAPRLAPSDVVAGG